MRTPANSWLTLDVGGANIKAAHSGGGVRSLPFALWRQPDQLAPTIARFATAFPPPGRIALTMTAELCDCFPTKREGVIAVLDAVETAFPGFPLAVWGLDGRLHAPEGVRDNPLVAAAANWLALATVAATLAGGGRGVLIDVGSTTTDVIPLQDGRPVPAGRTDTERLQTGELVYVGVRRTTVCALGESLPFRGRATGLAAELFATTRDVFLTLGDLPEDPDDLETADGRPATKAFARDRLARTVGADREGFTDGDAARLSEAAREAVLARLVTAAGRAGLAGSERPGVAVVAGSGEFLARRLAARLLAPGGRVVSLSERWGAEASGAACAYALRIVAEGHEETAG